MTTTRRTFLSTVGVGTTVPLAGCTERPVDTTDRAPVVTADPYDDVDFDTATHQKLVFHAHARGRVPWNQAPHQVIDQYVDSAHRPLDEPDVVEANYTIGGESAGSAAEPIAWPWEELSEIDAEWADRDPERLGAVSVPIREMSDVEHVNSLFTTLDEDPDWSDRRATIEAIASVDEGHAEGFPAGVAILAHVGRYVGARAGYEGPGEAWRRYVDDFEGVGVTSLPGGAFHDKTWVRSRETSTPRGVDRFDAERVWDHLLESFMPDRPVYTFGEDDPNEATVGWDVDVRTTWLLLEPSAFDPTAQSSSRRAVHDAVVSGHHYVTTRVPWHYASQDPHPVLELRDVSVDGDTVSIAFDPEPHRIEWISGPGAGGGNVVDTGTVIRLDERSVPYVRARATWHDEDVAYTGEFDWPTEHRRPLVETVTQPFGVGDP